MPDRKHRSRPPEAADRARRLSDPRRGAADRRICAPRVSASGAIGAPPRRISPTPPRSCRSAPRSNWWKGHGGDRCGARRPFAALPRHADGGTQQLAAGRAADVRLQDRGAARRDAAPPRTIGAVAPARAGRRVRRRGRNAGLARRRWPQGASRDDGGARPRPARHRLAHGARPHRRGRLLSRTPHRHARQDIHGREAPDADRGRRGLRAFPRGARIVEHDAAEAQSRSPASISIPPSRWFASTSPPCSKPRSPTTSARPDRGRSNGSRCPRSFCWRRARWRRPSCWSAASRSTPIACGPISISPAA